MPCFYNKIIQTEEPGSNEIEGGGGGQQEPEQYEDDYKNYEEGEGGDHEKNPDGEEQVDIFNFFKKNGPTPASFSFIFGLFKQTSLQFLQQIYVEKCPSSIRCRD